MLIFHVTASRHKTKINAGSFGICHMPSLLHPYLEHSGQLVGHAPLELTR